MQLEHEEILELLKVGLPAWRWKGTRNWGYHIEGRYKHLELSFIASNHGQTTISLIYRGHLTTVAYVKEAELLRRAKRLVIELIRNRARLVLTGKREARMLIRGLR